MIVLGIVVYLGLGILIVAACECFFPGVDYEDDTFLLGIAAIVWPVLILLGLIYSWFMIFGSVVKLFSEWVNNLRR